MIFPTVSSQFSPPEWTYYFFTFAKAWKKLIAARLIVNIGESPIILPLAGPHRRMRGRFPAKEQEKKIERTAANSAVIARLDQAIQSNIQRFQYVAGWPGFSNAGYHLCLLILGDSLIAGRGKHCYEALGLNAITRLRPP
jgi:hypothetical protein